MANKTVQMALSNGCMTVYDKICQMSGQNVDKCRLFHKLQII